MTEYQITSWRELPSLVVARDGDQVAKVSLPQRFQDAVDEAAMRLGETSSDAYLDGWQRTDWASSDGAPAEVAAQVAAGLEEQWPQPALQEFLDGIGPSPA